MPFKVDKPNLPDSSHDCARFEEVLESRVADFLAQPAPDFEEFSFKALSLLSKFIEELWHLFMLGICNHLHVKVPFISVNISLARLS